MPSTNVNHIPSFQLIDSLNVEVLEQLNEHLKYELELYSKYLKCI